VEWLKCRAQGCEFKPHCHKKKKRKKRKEGYFSPAARYKHQTSQNRKPFFVSYLVPHYKGPKSDEVIDDDMP
jgi:hypothetical protein